MTFTAILIQKKVQKTHLVIHLCDIYDIFHTKKCPKNAFSNPPLWQLLIE